MKTLTLLGAIFLPGTYLASVFSMTFFDFAAGESLRASPQLIPPGIIPLPSSSWKSTSGEQTITG